MEHELSFWRRLCYAFGYPGAQITHSIILNVGIYFYLPPEGAGLTTQLSDRILFGFLTTYGLARLIGGVVDSLADPIVGHLSDSSNSRLGRRRQFLLIGFVPMVILSAALFFPWGTPGSTQTFIFLTAGLCLYYVFYTIYLAPYLALLPEIARSEFARVEISRLRALVNTGLVMAFAGLWLAGVDLLKHLGMSAEHAVQLVVLVSAAGCAALCVLPILAINETKMAQAVPYTYGFLSALRATTRNTSFLIYLAGQICFIVGSHMMLPAIPYFTRIVLRRDEGFAAILCFALIPSVITGFVSIRSLVKRFGARDVLCFSSAMLGLSFFPYGMLTPSEPGSANDAFNIVAVCFLLMVHGLGLVGVMVLPPVLLSQLIDLDRENTKSNRAAMYFGVQGLFTKWVYAVSAAILTFLLVRFGRGEDQPSGILIVGPIAGVFCVVGSVIYLSLPKSPRLEEGIKATNA